MMGGMAMDCECRGMDGLLDKRADLGERLLRHVDAMRAALDVAGAAHECGGYWAEVEDMLDGMHGDLGSMPCH
jgi:hypothetical protein